MIREIILNGRQIQYEFVYKDVKNINLRIRADQSVFVSANKKISFETIDTYMQSKADYILKILDKYEEIAKYSPRPKELISGESFCILGRDLRLFLLAGKQNSVITDESYIYLTVTNITDYNLKKNTLDKWVTAKCQNVIQEICEKVYPKFKKYGVGFPNIRFREMISRWGSCQPKRKILTFNKRLIEVPISCIEYVVIHEFTHFLQPNHSKDFYHKLLLFMPDWKERKKLLDYEIVLGV